jgi:hypothetical protein
MARALESGFHAEAGAFHGLAADDGVARLPADPGLSLLAFSADADALSPAGPPPSR